MSVINKLASSLNRRDEVPNQELAKELATAKDAASIRELVEHLSIKNKDIQNDCIKVLYEIGELDPKLIAEHTPVFLGLLTSKNNRLQWGGMTALHTISRVDPGGIFSHITSILDAADKGSVITKDHAVNILIELCGHARYAGSAFALLNEQLLRSATNQLPMYAERALPIIDSGNKAVFIKTLTGRLSEIEKESKRKRVEKAIRKAEKSS